MHQESKIPEIKVSHSDNYFLTIKLILIHVIRPLGSMDQQTSNRYNVLTLASLGNH